MSTPDSLPGSALSQGKRALSLLDRRVYSPTYGCFDKNYWHFKTRDFPSASLQMGVAYLAEIWSYENKENPFYHSDEILEYIDAAVRFICKIQHRDGSFDEWYPNERGWAGPTSYLVDSVFSTLKKVGGDLPAETIREVKIFLNRAGRFLTKYEESGYLGNHHALYLLSLKQIDKICGDEEFSSFYARGLDKFLGLASKEGWALEYDGVDLCYSLGTLTFLGRLHGITSDQRILEFAKKSFLFLSYFVLPDGSFGGELGSRSTVHLYPAGMSYWSEFVPVAARMDRHFHETGSYLDPSPGDQDDQYLFYRIAEYFYPSKGSVSKEVPLPFEGDEVWIKDFSESGFRIEKSSESYCILNYHRGGSLGIGRLDGSQRTILVSGLLVNEGGRQYSTSNWNIQTNSYNLEQGAITIRGKMIPIKFPVFSPSRHIGFRIGMLLFGWRAGSAQWLKGLVRRILIFPGTSNSKISFSRSIHIQANGIEIKDRIDGLATKSQVVMGGSLGVRYVPQSNYYTFKSLGTPQKKWITSNKSFQLISRWDFSDKEVSHKCVE